MSSHFRNWGTIAYPHKQGPLHDDAYTSPRLLNVHNVSQSTLCSITGSYSNNIRYKVELDLLHINVSGE